MLGYLPNDLNRQFESTRNWLLLHEVKKKWHTDHIASGRPPKRCRCTWWFTCCCCSNKSFQINWPNHLKLNQPFLSQVEHHQDQTAVRHCPCRFKECETYKFCRRLFYQCNQKLTLALGHRRSRPRSSLECVHTSEGFNIDQQVWASNPAGTIYDPPLRLEVWGAICRSRIRSQSLTCVPQKNCSAILFFLAPHECTQLVCIPI
jgi:hypothetical protein